MGKGLAGAVRQLLIEKWPEISAATVLAPAAIDDPAPNDKYHSLRRQTGRPRKPLQGVPSEEAELPPSMQAIKADGWEVEEWRHTLESAAIKAMQKDGIKFTVSGKASRIKTIEAYMADERIQKEAYMSHYDSTAKAGAPPMPTNKAPAGITAALWGSNDGSVRSQPPAATVEPPKARPTGALGIDTSSPPAPGTPEFEQEKKRRLEYWKQKAAEQLKIDAGSPL